jgi:alpha-beta hydrolase superfamily lysophospholipase
MSDSVALMSKIVISALLAYIVLILLAYIFQRKLLYLPNNDQLSAAQASYQGLKHWPSTDDFRGLMAAAQATSTQGSVIVFHGNAGAAYDRAYYIAALSALGLRVILAEYPGYGGRPGSPSEAVLVADALETVKIAHRRYGEPLYLWGESLGCGIVAGVVAKIAAEIAEPPVAGTMGHSGLSISGVILLSPWDSLAQVAQAHYWFLPARWLTRDQYRNRENLQEYQGNVAVILAGNDEIVPLQHSNALFNAISSPKKLWLFEGATHNNLPLRPELPWWQEVVTFISH